MGRRRRPLSLLAPRVLLLLPPLLLLLGAATAAGSDSSGLEGSPPPGQSTAMGPTSPSPGNPRQSQRLGSGAPAPLTLLRPSFAPSSAGDAPRGAPTRGLPSQGAPDTPLAAQGAGRGASGPGARGHSRPPLLTSATIVTLLPMLALLPGTTSPKAVAGPASSPPSLPDRIPGSGTGRSAREAWQPTSPTVPLGQSTQEVTQPNRTQRGLLDLLRGSEAPLGTTADGKEAPCTAAAEGLEMPSTEPPCPNGAGCCQTHQEAKSPAADVPGPGRAPAWPPDMETAEPGPSAAPGQGWDVAAIARPLAQLLPHSQTSGPFGTTAEVLSEQPGGGAAYTASARAPGRHPETGPPEPGTAVGPFRPASALPPPPTPTLSTAGARPAAGTAEEVTLPSTFAGHPVSSVHNQAAQLPRTEAGGESRPPPPSGDGVSSSAVVGGTEGPSSLPFPSPRLGTALPWSSTGSTTQLASLRGNDRESSAPLLSWGGSAMGVTVALGAVLRSSVNTASSSSSLGSVASDTVALWEGPSAATSAGRGSRGPSEPYSTQSVKGADPTQPFPGPAQLGPQRPTDEGTLSGLMEAVTDQGETTGSRKGPCGATASPGQAGEGAFVGRATEPGELPVSRILGRGASAGWTISPTGSAVAFFSTQGGVLSSAPSRAPEPHMNVVVPTSDMGGAGLHPPPAPAAGTGSGELWEHPSLPTEGAMGEEATRSPQGPGPVSTGAASGPPPGGSWQPWPPESAPGPGSAPPIAGTWLSAAAPEEEEAPARAPAPAPPGEGEGRARSRHAFVVENQLPLLKVAVLRVPCELVLAMAFSRSFQDPASPEYQGLVLSINETVSPFFASVPGFQRLEVKGVRPGSVVVALDVLFLAGAPGLWAALNRSSLSERLPPGLWVANASVLHSAAPERSLDLCALLFSCRAGYACVPAENGSATCTSMCHRDYCKNQGICTHAANHTPICQCPVGSDFWFLGVRCDYKVTQQGLLGVACGLLLSLVVVGAAIAGMVIRRVRILLLEARADQTKSSYRRFCRLDDVSAHYWSEPWLASASSLDNPAFSNSEELLHLQILDASCCSCQEDCMAPDSYCKQMQDTCVRAAGRPSSRYNWAESSSSVNDPMIDSGKASEVSVSSWPLEPIQWSPFPVPHKLSREQMHKTQRPHSYCEGMELVSLERSWTA